MVKSIVALAIAAVAGIAMAFQGALNASLGKITGLLETAFIVHVIGSAIIAGLLFMPGLGQGGLAKVISVPWYLLLGGPLSVIIIYGVVASIARVGVAPATTAIITGQVLTALLIDNFGWFGLQRIELNWWKLLGLLIFALGAKLLLARGS
ncbi:MAG: DMT family transporter [Bacillota bacterium]